MTQAYAMVFEPILKEKVWGGRRLSRYGKRLAGTDSEGPRFGESWEIADLAATSVSGGGGGSAVSVIRNGAMAGKTIADAVGLWGADLLGERGLACAHRVGAQTGAGRAAFPLLIKYLDAGEHLSVQVHPSPSYAEGHPGAHLKTESWFVIETERAAMPDGAAVEPSVFVGLRNGVSEDGFRVGIDSGTVTGDLRVLPARTGDCHTLPSGTVHALGAGVLVAEVQTPSDTTFRVYDWMDEYGRPERALHVEEAMACIDFAGGDAAPCVDASGGARAAETAFYTIDAVHGAWSLADVLPAGGMAVVMVHAGRGRLIGAGEGVEVGPGATVLVPAACAGAARLEGDAGLRSLVIGLGA